MISEFMMQGTHEGEWIGIKLTHKTLIFTGVDIDRVVNEKIVEQERCLQKCSWIKGKK